MRRILLPLLIVAACATVAPARATCVAASQYDTGTVTFGNVTIYAEQFGNFATGPVVACGDGSVGREAAARGLLRITVDGEVVCTSTTRLSADPFGFGAGIHSPESDACGAEISFDSFNESFTADPRDAGAGTSGAHAGLRKASFVFGSYWVGATRVELPAEADGYWTRGARVLAG